MNATRLEHHHQKKCYYEANDAPFQSPENGVEHLRLDCNRGVFGFKRSACETLSERGVPAKDVSLSAPVVLPIRLSLCRERLAWGVPQRATLLNAAAGRRKTRRVRIRPSREALPVPATLRVLKMQRANLYMYHVWRRLEFNGKSFLIKNVPSSNIRSL